MPLGKLSLARIGRRTPDPAQRSRRGLVPGSIPYWHPGIARGYRMDVRYKPKLTLQNYYSANVATAYGNLYAAEQHLGDLFNDVMGAVVPGWDARPDWMKKIVVRPDPTKLLNMARQVSPDAAGQIVGAANRAGLNVYVNTPGGQLPITPGTAQSMYESLPMFARAESMISDIPRWVWLVAGGGLVLVFALSMRRR